MAIVLIDKIAPKNDAFLGMVDHSQVLTNGVTSGNLVMFGGTVLLDSGMPLSGVATIAYVDSAVGSGSITSHSDLTDLLNDDHTQYFLIDGGRNITGDVRADGNITVSGVAAYSDWTGFDVNNSGSFVPLWYFSATSSGVTDHTQLTSIGINTHAQIDTHIDEADAHFASGDIHFYQEEVDHTRIQNIGSNSHIDIDSHISDTTIHYISGNIDHGALQGLADNDHPQYAMFTELDTHSGDATIHFTESSIDHGSITGLSDNDHPQYAMFTELDTHSGDITIHFTEGSIDHGSITGLSDNDHTQYVAKDGLGAFTGTISGVTPVNDAHLTTKGYVDEQVAIASGVTDHTQLSNIGTNDHDTIDLHIGDGTIHFTTEGINHGDISGLSDNDHPQYTLVNGTVAFTGTISGVTPSEDAHLTTKSYVDEQVSIASGVTHHGNLTGLTNDDHTQYVLTGAQRNITGAMEFDSSITISGAAAYADWTGLDLNNSGSFIPLWYYKATASGVTDHTQLTSIGTNTHAQIDSHIGDGSIHFTEGTIDHGSIAGLSDNDHTQYVTKDGLGAFTGTISGVTPSEDLHLTTKKYVDDSLYQIPLLSGDLYSLSDSFDTHTASGDIHFYQEAIDHTRIQNVGTNDHTAIDSHISDGTIHFTEGSIDHGSISGLTDNDHTQYTTKDGLGAFTGTVSGVTPTDDAHLTTKVYVDTEVSSVSSDITDHIASGDVHYFQESIDHTVIQNIGTNNHNLIDNHLASGDLHYYEDAIDHTNIQNIGTNSHDQIDSHIGDGTIHFTEASIDHGSITGLSDNDHEQYVTKDGFGAFTGTVSGVTPVDGAHLATKDYVDTASTPVYSGTVEGTGTANYIPVWIDDNSLTDSPMTVDGTTVHVSGEFVLNNTIGTPLYTSMTDFITIRHSSAWLSGGEFTDNGDGTLAVSSGTGMIRMSNSSTAGLKWFEWPDDNSVSLVDNSTNYIYIDYNNGDPIIASTTTKSNINGNNNVGLGQVFREGNSVDSFKAGFAFADFEKKVIQRLNATGDITLTSGGSVSESGVRYLDVTAATLFGGVTKFITSSINTALGDEFEYYHSDSISGWIEYDAHQINNTHYDNGAGLSLLTNNRYRTDWVYLSNNGTLLVKYGTNDDALLATAQAEIPPSSLPVHISDFSTLIAQVIVQEGVTNVTEINNISTTTFTSTGAGDHGELTGLGDDDHVQYSLVTGQRPFTGTISGVYPINDGHLATKEYVDDQASDTSAHIASGDIHFFQEDINHTRIQNIGTNSHSVIDTHIADTTIHYISGNIDHGALQGLEDNDHPQYALFTELDTHSGDLSLHFTEASIDHGNITGLTDNDHTQYVLEDGTNAFTGTVSGVTPTEDNHLATKSYVDGQVVTDHGSLTGLTDNDHTQYVLEDGTNPFTGTVSGVTPTEDNHLATKGYVDGVIVSDHGSLTGLTDNDHTQYVLADGTKAFSGTVSGVFPTEDGHLTTKEYVDDQLYQIPLLSGDLYTHTVDSTIHFTEASIDHTAISNIGTNNHDQIDVHLASGQIHFYEDAIDHTNIQNIGTNSHTEIDSHISDSTLHFTEGSIDHGSIGGLTDNDHTQYSLIDGTSAYSAPVSGVSPVNDNHLTTKYWVEEHVSGQIPTLSKSISVESPTNSEDITLFYTDIAITMKEFNTVMTGTSPSITYTVKHESDRSAAGDEVVTGGSTTTSTTAGDSVTSFNDATVPANRWLWLETTASGVAQTSFHITMRYTED